MDISDTLTAKSDQLNASDLSGGPVTATVESVDVLKGNDQPVHIHLVGMKGRPYKPSKGMRRVIAQAWGPDSDAYVGKSMTLYRNPEVTWAGEKIGGVEISHMSHMDGPLTTSVRVNRKSSRPHVVQPLTEPATEPWRAQWQAITNALTAAGYEGDGQQMLATARQVIGAEWTHPQQISAGDARKILAAVREDQHKEADA